ncbi:hypothetical protein A2313_03990 [Candidatus Roizmanbacteria bacterium RIFOXYB2_FULL_41_10]|uniref:Uncharacterized protein n=1 Tax=Candidatus Roizmanbacteria bacterium RIFOXYA1_FULL_41_12 TaxID=1802082 RepID=A0A1F7KAY5_9BACT|nr:MAG: hypothetical protein A2209_00420 [Candidatus Roizmanbacteria bacterium RIFOXYA1_FULL_41_12]OGK66594.1 MAG: hypothetical protein A2377_00195 [Candidatus Roizmanbacteria bacterium RIFOXYB1_FULL_41_27]OGK69267.1 MAG: hypothetical protein A2313_03990 [Candidatus Roizmanbacteria bacterium RIFOXYB2_FULL_41_10]OGK75803.1 MAG: hypothetical protein A2459_02120 [Candidatus Roizmanbacteria bacterium RIFOXYC2_FULL_41_10]
MFAFLEIPWIPILSLLMIVPLIGWQTIAYFKEKAKNKVPQIPQINSNKVQNKTSKDVKNVTLITNLKPRGKNIKKISLVFSFTVTAFVILNLVIVTFYLNNRKISYLPRASESITPTTVITTKPSIVPTISDAPIITVSPIITNAPTMTIAPTITMAPTMTMMPTVTVGPTLIAQAYTVPTVRPTSSPTPTVIITTAPKLTTVSPTAIPVVGVGKFSIILGVLSVFFLILGFVL